MLVVECPKCSRTGRYALRRLIEQRGRDVQILDWLDRLAADCPGKRAAGALVVVEERERRPAMRYKAPAGSGKPLSVIPVAMVSRP